VLCPLQIVAGAAVGATVGFAFTFTKTLPVTVHELELVTVTVYVVLVVGETLPPATLPDKPLLHAYVEILPLPAVELVASVVLCPLQIVAGVAVGAMVGFALTVTVVEAVPLQPFKSVAVTLYVPLIIVVAFPRFGF